MDGEAQADNRGSDQTAVWRRQDGDVLFSTLLGRVVVDERERPLGQIHDLRVRSVAEPLVTGLLVGGRSLRVRLFGERPEDDQTPRRTSVVGLEDVRDTGADPIVAKTKERG